VHNNRNLSSFVFSTSLAPSAHAMASVRTRRSAALAATPDKGMRVEDGEPHSLDKSSKHVNMNTSASSRTKHSDLSDGHANQTPAASQSASTPRHLTKCQEGSSIWKRYNDEYEHAVAQGERRLMFCRCMRLPADPCLRMLLQTAPSCPHTLTPGIADHWSNHSFGGSSICIPSLVAPTW